MSVTLQPSPTEDTPSDVHDSPQAVFMKPYPKVNSVYKRDPATKHNTFLDGEWSEPEFGMLADLTWVATEKVDGTNVRIGVGSDSFQVGGRTNKAQLAVPLTERLQEIGQRAVTAGLSGLTLYGEGFGGNIQKVGPHYGDLDVILFDIQASSGVWLQRSDIDAIALLLDVMSVPVVGRATLRQLVKAASENGPFESQLVDNGLLAEGLVAVPQGDLRNRMGGRIVTKLKYRDWAVW